MYKACSRCGKVHDSNYKCPTNRIYRTTDENRLRSRFAWTQKSLEIREKGNYLCEVCKDHGVYTYEGVEVHHIVKIKDNKDIYLENENLVALCLLHHRQADDGELDADYLRQLARHREGK